jgi:hypothetical protein
MTAMLISRQRKSRNEYSHPAYICVQMKYSFRHERVSQQSTGWAST